MPITCASSREGWKAVVLGYCHLTRTCDGVHLVAAARRLENVAAWHLLEHCRSDRVGNVDHRSSFRCSLKPRNCSLPGALLPRIAVGGVWERANSEDCRCSSGSQKRSDHLVQRPHRALGRRGSPTIFAVRDSAAGTTRLCRPPSRGVRSLRSTRRVGEMLRRAAHDPERTKSHRPTWSPTMANST